MHSPQAPLDDHRSKRLILHIGFHKTGTSAIQEALFGLRVALRDHGVVYPQPISPHFSHLDLASALQFNPRSEELADYPGDLLIDRYRRLIDDAPPRSTIILSSEEFCQGNSFPEAMDNLQTFVDPLDVELVIVAYTRDPLQFLLSIYHHELRDIDTTIGFDKWVDSFPLEAADFAARLAPWYERFGTAVIQVRDYETLRSSRRSITRDLLDSIGLSEVELELGERRVNVGIHPRLVEPVIAIRTSDLAEERKAYLLGQLQDIGMLMPAEDAAALYLGTDGKAKLLNRLGTQASTQA